MKTILDYIFLEPFPGDWLMQDIIAILLTFLVLVFIVRREKHAAIVILEMAAFVFLYASIYENAAIVMGLYSYGRSLVMIGFVPASVPLIEACVLITGLWFLEKTRVPQWAWAPIIGLFGMLQDFSLDPLAIRQIHTVGAVTSGRWNWLINPASDANILRIPVFNFPGWMLIMFYSTICLLIGRWWYKKSGYRPLVGYIYPLITMVAALLLMISPLSNFLLWLGPFFQKGQSIEWVMLAFHLVIPSALLIFLWRGKMTSRFTANDLPIFIVPTVLHLSDILFTVLGGYTEILWIVLLASALQTAFLLFAWVNNRHAPITENQ
ncbi:MAG TPA: hypothetical protein PLL88_00825 [Anaerolineaceae bacterium]|nr:hypothetical protein [Anaerolineaceae bacterium]